MMSASDQNSNITFLRNEFSKIYDDVIYGVDSLLWSFEN